jgi:hypothetical protein
MDQLLAQAIPTDRVIEKTFRGWLANCHQSLDKTMTFSQLMPDQAAMRRRFGESCTFFGSMSDGARTISVRVVACSCLQILALQDKEEPRLGGAACITMLCEESWQS